MSSSVASKLAAGKHHKKSSDAVTSNSYQSPSTNLHIAILDLQSTAGNLAVRQMIRSAGANPAQKDNSIPQIVQDVLSSGGGQPLGRDTREYMESRFGYDFSRVRVHANVQAAESARAIRAKAYTVGTNVVFNEGRYAPNTAEGGKLLAHELAHVLQQRQGGAIPTLDPCASHEHAADAAASAVNQGHTVTNVGAGTAVGLSRQQDESAPPPEGSLEARLREIEREIQLRPMKASDRASANRVVEEIRQRAHAEPDTSFAYAILEELENKLEQQKTRSGYSEVLEPDTRTLLEKKSPTREEKQKAVRKEAEKLGEMGGRERAEKQKITVDADWKPPQKFKGDFGQGIDDKGARNGYTYIIEYKYGSSPLDKETGQMSNEWVGRKIAELQFEGDVEAARELLEAARAGRLRGVVYSTQQRKGEDVTVRRPGNYLRDKLGNESVTDSGIIQYSRTKVFNGYEKRLLELNEQKHVVLEPLMPRKALTASSSKPAPALIGDWETGFRTQEEQAKEPSPSTTAPKASAPPDPAQVTAQPIKAAAPQAAATPEPSPESAAMAQTSEETAQPLKTPVKTSRATSSTQTKKSVSAQQHAPSPDDTPRAPVRGARTVHTEFGDRVKVAVEDIHGATDTPFRVTTTITLNTGAGGGASVEKSGAGTTGANVSGTGRISVSFSRMMSAAEKETYLAAVGVHRGGTTDLQLIELIASGKEGQAANMLQTVQQRLYGTGPFASPREGALAAPPREGEYVEVDLEGDLTAGVSAGRGSIGAHAQRSMGKGLRQRSMYVGGKEQITVTLTDRSSNTIGGLVGFGAGSMGVRGYEGQSGENAVEFTLDPAWKDYAQIRRELLTATSVDDLRAIAAAHPNHPDLVTGGLESEERSTGRDTDLTVGGVGVRLKRSGAIGKGSERRGEKTYRTVTGSGTTGVGLLAGDREIDPFTRTDSLRGRVGPGNEGEAVTQSERSEIDIPKSVSILTEQAKAHLLGTSVAVAKGQKTILQKRVDTKGMFLDSASIARIAELAKDENKDRWLRAWDLKGMSQGAAHEWEATRQKIRDAEGKQDVILEALAEWEAGASGRSGDVERLATGTGAAFQFSDENAEQKQNFDDLVVHDPTEKAHRLAEAGDRKAAVAELQAINRQLGSLAQNIQQFTTGIDARRLNAMLDRVYARRQAIASELVALQAGDVAPSEGALRAPEATDEERTRAAVGQRIRDLTALCVTNQYMEREVLDRVSDKLDTRYLRGTEYAAVRNEMDELEAVYTKWDVNVEELKQLRKQLGLSPDFAKGVAPNRARFQALRSDPKLRRVQGR
ncbi:MAG: DUF4157 domain-containing protein [Nitrospira sp.]|nr:DUF4157 domain-containing protein [Nitrospira sp.]